VSLEDPARLKFAARCLPILIPALYSILSLVRTESVGIESHVPDEEKQAEPSNVWPPEIDRDLPRWRSGTTPKYHWS
jgi:hypothetical protein